MSKALATKMKLTPSTNLLVNPKHFATGYMDRSLFFVHFSNILYARKIIGRQLPVSFMGSNELFVKHGVEDYVKKNTFRTENVSTHDFHYLGFSQDKDFTWLSEKYENILKSMPEGTFYNAEQIENGIRNLNKNMDYKLAEKKLEYFCNLRRYRSILERGLTKFTGRSINSGTTYAAEEIILPTLFQAKLGDNNSYCYSRPSDNFMYEQNDKHKLLNCRSKFSFKRVERNPKSKQRERILKDFGLI